MWASGVVPWLETESIPLEPDLGNASVGSEPFLGAYSSPFLIFLPKEGVC